MAASLLDGEITFFSETRGDKITFVANKRQSVAIGSNPTCDVRILGANDVHMTIQLDQTGKVKATNLSKDEPIFINGETITDKRTLKSGDIISIMSHQLRWDTKTELRRRTAALTKSARKEAKHRVIRTAKRLTIHNLLSKHEPPADQSTSVDVIPEQLEEVKETIDGSPPKNGNNLSKLSSLNMSGTLITSFTPQKSTARSSLRTTPQKNPTNASQSTPLVNSVLDESSTLNRSSMHLVDLTGTPIVKRHKTPSKRTPLSVKKTPTVRTTTLLKSAIKNSSIKKRINDTQQQSRSAAKAKSLFGSPIMDVSHTSSSVMSVSFNSAKEEARETKSVGECSNQSQDGSDSISDEETKTLLDNISTILDENPTPKKNKSLLVESERTPEIERNFEKILEKTNIPPADQIDSDFNNINPSEETKDDSQNKVESLLNWIENARESLASNNTEQVLSSRYSNVTPNDSVVTTTTVAYDIKTPKMSILDTVQDLRKSEVLAMSPVARLSINDNSTVVVENFKLNNDIPKSLRSTRKRIGMAMNSLHDVSQNQNSTLDETLNFSLLTNMPVKDDQLDASTNDILSLDAPAQNQADESMEYDENAENIPPSTSNNFIEFAGHSDNDETEREFFEISNSDIDENDLQEIQESSSSSEESENESEAEEIVGSSQEVTEQKSKDVALKFRLSEQDLEEDGINPLDISTRTDDQIENDENEASQPPVEDEDIEIPATQQVLDDVEFPATEEFSTDQMNEIIDGDGSIGMLDSKTQEVESVLEEHLELSNVSASLEPNLQQESESTVESMIEERLDTTDENIAVNEDVLQVDNQDEELSGKNETSIEVQNTESDDIVPCSQAVNEDLKLEALSSAETVSDVTVKNSDDALELSEANNILEAKSSETLIEQLDDDDDENLPSESQNQETENSEVDDPTQSDAMMSSEEIDAENEIMEMEKSQEEMNESVELFATQADDYAIPDDIEMPDASSQSLGMSSWGDARNVVDTPNNKASLQPDTPERDQSHMNDIVEEEEASPTASTVLDEIKDESVSIKISVSVEEKRESVDTEDEPEKVSEVLFIDSEEEKIPTQEDVNKSFEIVEDVKVEEKLSEAKDESRVLQIDSDSNDDAEDITENKQDPVVEEPCVKKFAYETTDKDAEEALSAQSLTIQEELGDDLIEEKPQTVEVEASEAPEIQVEASVEEAISEIIVEKNNEEIEESESKEITLAVNENIEAPLVTVVEENIEKQEETVTVTPPTEKIELPTPRRRARVNYLELAGSPAKTPSRRGRSASIEGASNKSVATPKPPPRSARKLMAPIAEKSSPEKIESDTKRESEDFPAREKTPQKEKTPKKRMAKTTPSVFTSSVRRGRSASVDVKPIPLKDHVDSPAKSEQQESVKKRGGRRRVASETVDVNQLNHEEPPKKRARARHAAVDEDEQSKSEEVSTEKHETKKGKGKTTEKELTETNVTDEQTPAKRGRARKKVKEASTEEPAESEMPIEEKAKSVEASESKKGHKLAASTEEPKETPVKKGRGGRKKVEEPPTEEPAESEMPIEEKVKSVEASESKKGRKLAVSTEEPKETPVKKGRGGRKKVEKVPEDEPKETPVSKGRARKKIEEASEKLDESEEQPKEIPAKKGRARKKAEEVELSSESQENKSEEQEKEIIPVKKGRGRKKVEKVEEEPSVEVDLKSKRAKDASHTSPTKEAESFEVVEQETKSKRGKTAHHKSPEKESIPEPEEEAPTTSKRKNARKNAVEKPKEPEEPVKKARGRKKAVKEVVEVQEDEEEKVAESPKARGRAPKVVEEKMEPPQEKPAPKKRGRAAKHPKEVVEVVASQEAKPEVTPKKRVGKHVTIVTPATELLKKAQVSSEEVPTNSTSRKRQAQPELPAVSEEPVAKRLTRKNALTR